LLGQNEPSWRQVQEEMLALNATVPPQNVAAAAALLAETRAANVDLLAALSSPTRSDLALAAAATTGTLPAVAATARHTRAAIPCIASTTTTGVPSAWSLVQDLQSAQGGRGGVLDVAASSTLSLLQRQQQWQQERLLADRLLPVAQTLHQLPAQGLDLASLASLQMYRRNQQLEHMWNSARPASPSLTQDLDEMIQLEQLLRRGNTSGRRF
jgi:hypothetical protein